MKVRMLQLATLALLVISASALAEKKGVEHFFKKPEFAGFQVSPDGKHLAALAPIGDRMNLVVMDLETRTPRVVTSETDQDISGFNWANNERLLFTMDKDGSESFGMFAVNIDGSRPRTLAPPLAAQVSNGSRVVRFTGLLNTLEDDDKHVLVVNNDRNAAFPDIYKMNVYTGRKRLEQRNPGDIAGWFLDWEGQVIGGGFTDGIYAGWKRINPESGEFEEVVRTRFDQGSFSPAFLSGDGETGFVVSNVTPDGQPLDRAALYEYNFSTNEFGDLVFQHDIVDVGGVMVSGKDRKAIGVTYALGQPERHWLDDRWASVQAGLDQALPGTINSISSIDDEETIAVITTWSDTQPPVYYLYDLENSSLEFLASSRSWIEPDSMSPMKLYSFTARDGRTLHGFITLPKGSEGKNLPVVVNPHGGPWAADSWGYNPEHQFFADRGYAVLQVNFRGSTGFGMDHMLASRKQWGQAMQDDITDALNWAAGEGYVDKDRACIYGASYGGYAAMAGLTFTPDLYRCGINYVGVTDLPLLFETAPDSWAGNRERMEELIGDYDTEQEFLQQWSPSNHADKIQVPVFMAYGETDPRVDIQHFEVMEAAMKNAGVEFESMVKEDEGHGFRKQENVYEFYTAVDEFLARHLNP
ncbi:MAG: S9 family peptidase [Pseudomonadota bacterium]